MCDGNYNETDILDLSLDDFVAMLIREGKFKTVRDAKLFLLENVATVEAEGTTEFPIAYYEGDEANAAPELVAYDGVALTDDLIEKMKSDPNILD